MRLDDGPIFLLRPTFLADVGVEMVVPPLSALLADPPRQVLGNEAPILWPVGLDKLQDQFIFLFRLYSLKIYPWSLDKRGVQDLLPAMQALHVCPVYQK